MNLLQALSKIPKLTPSLGAVYDAPPVAPPKGAYAVVSDISDVAISTALDYQDRQVTVLVSIYGAEGGTLGSIRPLVTRVRELYRVITSHPGFPPIAGVLLGPTLPPAFDPQTKRPFAGVRFLISYRSN